MCVLTCVGGRYTVRACMCTSALVHACEYMEVMYTGQEWSKYGRREFGGPPDVVGVSGLSNA